MKPRRCDPPLESLYTEAPTSVLYRGEEDEEKLVVKGPVRLHRIDSCDVTELGNAVAPLGVSFRKPIPGLLASCI
jgi:hypothetical protein